MKDQVVIITGASRGIGRATALRLAEAGAQVVAVARSEQALAETRSLVQARGGRCRTATADVGSYDDVERVVQSTCRDLGRVDVLVSNAGSAVMSKMEDHEVPAFEAMMAVNCNAVFYAARALWPVFIRQQGGRLVNISSVAAVDPFPGFQAYGATKAWVNSFTHALAAEGRKHNIRVYAVAPGAVDTGMLRQYFPDYPADHCLGPDDIAEAVAWVLDPRSRHASGSVVYVRKE